MSVAIVLVAIAAILFMLAFLMKRRFGVLGLALAAGFVISGFWAEAVTPLAVHIGLHFTQFPVRSIIVIVLTLLPAVLLLASGPTYSSGLLRIFGAGLFAVLAIALLVDPLRSTLIVTGPSKVVYDLLVHYKTTIITLGLTVAILDLFMTKMPRSKHKNIHRD